MAVLVGIDEAGYGPLLGPLVISMSVFQLPDKSLNKDHWKVLKAAVAKDKKNLAGRLLITDSKKAYNSVVGIEHLQRTVLSFLFCKNKMPANIYDIMGILCPECLNRVIEYQWYKDIRQCQLSFDFDSINLSTSVLNRTLKKASYDILELQSFCLDVKYFNNQISVTNNKAVVSFTSICRFISQCFQKYGDDNLQIIIDRQGGRIDYTGQLMTMFPDCEVAVLKQSPKLSSYMLVSNGKKMKIHFVVKADDYHLPVALASMTSKYLRELLIEQLNRYFLAHHPQLKTTAGYWNDGKRFIKEINEHCPQVKYDNSHLIRKK